MPSYQASPIMPVLISDSASVDNDEVELCESRCGCTHGCEHGLGDLKDTCSGSHYVCENCNKRVGSNWVNCTTVCVLKTMFMAAIVNISVCMIQDTRVTIHNIPYEHKAILGAPSHGWFVLCWFDSQLYVIFTGHVYNVYMSINYYYYA